MICKNCGSIANNDDRFCPNCGVELNSVVADDASTEEAYAVIHSSGNRIDDANLSQALSVYYTFFNKLETVATIWLVIGIIQLVIGVITLFFCYGALAIVLGIWNIVQSTRTRNNAKYFKRTSKGAVSYVDRSSSGVAALILNILFGCIIGIIPAAMDVSAISYGKKNRRFIALVENNEYL